jgi:hypothetical protein
VQEVGHGEPSLSKTLEKNLKSNIVSWSFCKKTELVEKLWVGEVGTVASGCGSEQFSILHLAQREG